MEKTMKCYFRSGGVVLVSMLVCSLGACSGAKGQNADGGIGTADGGRADAGGLDHGLSGLPIPEGETVIALPYPLAGSLIYGGDPTLLSPIRPSVDFDEFEGTFNIPATYDLFKQQVATVSFGLDYMGSQAMQHFEINDPNGAQKGFDVPFAGLEEDVSRQKLDGSYDAQESNGQPRVAMTRSGAQSLLETLSLGAMDLGVQHYMFDEAYLTDGPFSFDDDTMEGFRSWLDKNIPAAERTAVLGIADVSAFNFKTWILDRLAAESVGISSGDAFVSELMFVGEPMLLAFRAYLYQFQRTYIAALVAKVHAKNASAKCTFNIGLAGDVVLQGISDFPMSETHNEFYPDKQRLTPFYKLHSAAGLALFSWTSPHVERVDSTYKVPQSITLFAVESAVSGGGFVFPTTLHSEPWAANWWKSADLAAVRKQLVDQLYPVLWLRTRFASQFGLVPQARAALLYSLEDETIAAGPEGPVETFMSGAMLLADLHIQYKPVVIGGGLLHLNDRPLTAERLAGFSLVVLPEYRRLTPGAKEALLDFVSKGGVVLALGNIGDLDFWHRPISADANGQWGTLFSSAGSKSHGAGQVHVLGSDFAGEAYRTTSSKRSELRAAVEAQMPTAPYKLVDSTLPDQVAIHVAEDSDGSLVLYLINYNYDANGNTITPVGPSQISVSKPNTNGQLQISWMPLGRLPSILPSTSQNDRLALDLPAFESFAILRIGSPMLKTD